MSDILIKNMKMPQACSQCNFCQGFECVALKRKFNRIRKEDCPLVEVPTWIPVSERLPENDKTVLVWNRRNSREYFNAYDHGKWVIMETEDITHWMPLPEPPKDGA